MKVKFTNWRLDEAIITVGMPFFRRQAEVTDSLDKAGYGPKSWRFKNSRVLLPFWMRFRLNLRQTLHMAGIGIKEFFVDSWKSRRERLEASRKDWTPVSKFPTARLLDKEDV